MLLNDVFICVILLEIIFILWFINKSEILKEEMSNILPANMSNDPTLTTNYLVKLSIVLISIPTALFASYHAAHVIQMHYKINYIVMMVFMWINFVLYVEYKMSSSLNYASTTEDLQSALDRSRTGDFIFYRSYYTSDICDYISFRIVSSIITSAPYFSHVGMIVKINGVAYLLENAVSTYFCTHANKMKSGVKLTNAYDLINGCTAKVYLSRNNLHNHIREEDVGAFMNKYGHGLFLENNMFCITTIFKFLHFANVLKNEQNSILSINKLNQSELYTCDFKNIENVELKTTYYYKCLNNE